MFFFSFFVVFFAALNRWFELEYNRRNQQKYVHRQWRRHEHSLTQNKRATKLHFHWYLNKLCAQWHRHNSMAYHISYRRYLVVFSVVRTHTSYGIPASLIHSFIHSKKKLCSFFSLSRRQALFWHAIKQNICIIKRRKLRSLLFRFSLWWSHQNSAHAQMRSQSSRIRIGFMCICNMCLRLYLLSLMFMQSM